MLRDILPAGVRRVIYIVYAVIGVGLGAVSVWCEAAGTSTPGWYIPVVAVVGFLGTALGAVAASNAPPTPVDELVAHVADDVDLEDSPR